MSRFREQSQRMSANTRDYEERNVAQRGHERDAEDLRGSLVNGVGVNMHC